MPYLSKALSLRLHLKFHMLLVSIVFLVLVSLVTWAVISRSQDALIEFEAIKLAEIVAEQASAARSVYAMLAVSKLAADGYGASENSESMPGHIPLPAQFLRELSQRSQNTPDAVYRFKPVSRWNLAEDQGITDPFQRWAWAGLEAQQASKTTGAIAWRPVWRIEEKDGEPTLRYMKSDPANSRSCVSCHNELEKSPEVIARRIAGGEAPGKQWELYDLLGAIEISIPLDQAVTLAKSQTQHGLFTVVGVTLIGLAGVALLIFIDAARNRTMTNELSHQARHDSLTGLPNRLHFEMQVGEFLERQQAFSVMLLDLDNFKQINDTLGHEAGDIVLCECSVRIQSVLPAGGFAARLGGDEFALIIPSTDRVMLNRVVDDIAGEIDQSYNVQSYDVALGVSIGIALYPSHGTQMSELLRCADVAMYLAKNAGKNSVLYNAENDNNHVSKLLLNNALKEAITANEISVHFQPQYCLQSGQMKGVEALARWNSTEHGFIPPNVFIPMAETLGLINDLTEDILAKALRACQQWRQRDFDLSVSVNLSALCLSNRDIVDIIKQTLESLQMAPETLVIEVTEGTVMKDPGKGIAVLEALRDLGVRVSIDDYGTGYCSLSYLTTLPIHELKLDKSFIQKIHSNEKDALVVKATHELSRNLNLVMVAEGVEDAVPLDYLCNIGCELGQGYFLCRPLSATDFERRLPYIYRFNPRVKNTAKLVAVTHLSSDKKKAA